MANRRTLVDSAFPAAACGCLVVAAATLVGLPDLVAVSRLFTGAAPSLSSATALAIAMCWLVIVGAACTALLLLLLRPKRERPRLRSTLAVLCAIAGTLVLAVGVTNHTGRQYTMCCGGQPANISEALRLAH